MKRISKYISVAAIFLTYVQKIDAQNTFPATGAAGIGTTIPNASALLEVQSTTKGMLVPRMTQAQRNAIASPETGLLIFQTNASAGFYFYNGASWIQIATSITSADKTLSTLTAPTAINVDLLPGVDNNTDMGSLDRSWKNIYLKDALYIRGSKYISQSGIGSLFLGNTGNSSNTGSYNTASGELALFYNTTGSYNTAMGAEALRNNNTGHYNTASGSNTLYSNTTGRYNTANGYAALYTSTTGSSNTANGHRALFFNRTGYSNIAIGASTLYKNSTGHNLVAVGDSALYNQDGGTGYNSALGSKALFSNTTGSYNTATGSKTLYSSITGNYNTANGSNTLYSNTTGSYNTANGTSALYFNVTGSYNIAIGTSTLYFNTTGSYNIAIGQRALTYNSNGYSNIAIGASSLYGNSIGHNLVAVGDSALFNQYVNPYNEYLSTAIGSKALYSNSTGYRNTANGNNALYTNTTGWDNTALGSYADVTSYNFNNSTVLGSGASVDASNKVRIGNNYIMSIGGNVGWTSFSDGRYKKNIKEDVKGLSFINALRPITYTVDIKSLDAYCQKGRKGTEDSTYQKMRAAMANAEEEGSRIIYTGFVAQEVEAAAKKLNYNFSGVDKPKTKDGVYGLRYGDFVVPLVKAVQELSEENNELKKEIAEIKQMLVSLTGNKEAPYSADKTITLTNASLDQNIPNPFANTTVINYSLPQKFTKAQILITDNTGKMIKQINLSGTGKGSLKIDAATLAAGAYYYSLLIDAKIIATKQMIYSK